MPHYTRFTSESVTEGHPDKLADQISDAILDSLLAHDPKSRVAIETLLTRGLCVVAGELTTDAYVEIADVVRETAREVGYTHTDYGFDGDTCGVLVAIQKQSEDIAKGVDTGGAGDQGMMFGYAVDETAEYMPLALTIAHDLTRTLASVRKAETSLGLRPDGKAQVTIAYREDGTPDHIDTIVVSTQYDDDAEASVRRTVEERVIEPVLARFPEYRSDRICVHINPTGRFVIGGPQGDTGVTGRKIIVDTYGGSAPHGGGAFSGKDPTKVDRSAAYVARYVAKNIVAAGLARKVQIQLAYAIGVEDPVSVRCDTFGTSTIPESEIEARVERIGLTPRRMIERLRLTDASAIKYVQTAKNGHFGKPEFPWERLDLTDELMN